jgi:ABC-type lipoprotein release transport system permease subunit
MWRALLVIRLAVKDLRHRPAQSLLLLLAIATGASMLTLGLALGGTTNDPYARTRAATNGPDLVAEVAPPDALGSGSGQTRPGSAGPGSAGPGSQSNVADPAALVPLEHDPGVTGHAGPFPMTWGLVRLATGEGSALVVGRDSATSSVDRPQLLQGRWVRPGGVVVEAGFAAAAGIRIGDPLSIGGRSYEVVGTAVTASIPTYPDGCHYLGCFLVGRIGDHDPGLIWVPATDVQDIAAANDEPLFYLLDLTLRDPTGAPAFANRHAADAAATGTTLFTWQGIRDADAGVVGTVQQILFTGSLLLDLLALMSVAVLVGARMVEQTRRVGLLKAVGATPELVAAVLLVEHALIAMCGAGAGLLAGWLAAPSIDGPGAGLLGAAGAVSLTGSTIVVVAAVALVVALVATSVPAVRAARQSTVAALEDAARPPRRRDAVVRVSRRLPATLLVGLRLALRRPRRMVASALSIAVTTFGLVAVVTVDMTGWSLGPRAVQATAIVSVMLIALAAANAAFIAWATAIETRRPAALMRALGATPAQVTAGLSLAQLGPAIVGALVGIPVPIVLYLRGGRLSTVPPVVPLAAVVIVTLLAFGALTAAATLAASRGQVADVLELERG